MLVTLWPSGLYVGGQSRNHIYFPTVLFIQFAWGLADTCWRGIAAFSPNSFCSLAVVNRYFELFFSSNFQVVANPVFFSREMENYLQFVIGALSVDGLMNSHRIQSLKMGPTRRTSNFKRGLVDRSTFFKRYNVHTALFPLHRRNANHSTGLVIIQWNQNTRQYKFSSTPKICCSIQKR